MSKSKANATTFSEGQAEKLADAALGVPNKSTKVLVEALLIVYKWEVYAGYGYTSLKSGEPVAQRLAGWERLYYTDWGKYFGVTGDGAYYSYPFDTPVVATAR